MLPCRISLTGEVSADVITAADCAAVDAAMLATQMREWPSQCNFETILDPDAPFVPGDIEVFSRDLRQPARCVGL